IDLLSEVALTEEAQYKEVKKKSLRDFYKTHPSGFGTVTKTTPSAAKIKPSITNEGTSVKLGVLDVTEEESTERSNSEHETDENESGSESHQEENEEEIKDDEEKEDEFVKTSCNDTDDEDEPKIIYKTKGDEDEGIDYATNQFDDDVNVRLNEPVDTDEGLIQKDSRSEGSDKERDSGSKSDQEENEEDVEDDEGENDDELVKTPSNSTDDKDETKLKIKLKVIKMKEWIILPIRNENPKISQVTEDTHVTLYTVPQKTKVPVTSSSHSSDLASKFLKNLDIPHTDAEIVSPMDVSVHHEVPSNQTPILLTVLVSVITDSSLVYSTVILQSLPSFTPPPQQ
ncbi:hypothetical protein Tco_1173913, partial [Tanacetum coccineum]